MIDLILRRFLRNIKDKPLYTLVGLFPVSKHEPPDTISGQKPSAYTDGVCKQFEK